MSCAVTLRHRSAACPTYGMRSPQVAIASELMDVLPYSCLGWTKLRPPRLTSRCGREGSEPEATSKAEVESNAALMLVGRGRALRELAPDRGQGFERCIDVRIGRSLRCDGHPQCDPAADSGCHHE